MRYVNFHIVPYAVNESIGWKSKHFLRITVELPSFDILIYFFDGYLCLDDFAPIEFYGIAKHSYVCVSVFLCLFVCGSNCH